MFNFPILNACLSLFQSHIFFVRGISYCILFQTVIYVDLVENIPRRPLFHEVLFTLAILFISFNSVGQFKRVYFVS